MTDLPDRFGTYSQGGLAQDNTTPYWRSIFGALSKIEEKIATQKFSDGIDG